MGGAGRKIWFPAKKRGWGWGLPITWQGWVALIGYLVLMTAGALALEDGISVLLFLLYALGLSIAFLAICWLKGEKPEWR